jgi:LPS export ABC transporter permease LptG/LPS export ABC transporter permease LptF
MRLLSRYIFREILTSAVLGTLLATFIIFLRAADKLFAILVGANNASVSSVVELLLWAMPPVLPLTIPFGVLVGILIGLGRMAADGEITAMRAAGVSSRRVIAPVVVFAAVGMSLAGLASLRLTPLAIRRSTEIINQLLQGQVSAAIDPRVFNENFPNRILYVGDVGNGPVVAWRPVFIADITAPEQRASGMREKAEGPMITVARQAIAVSDPGNNRIQLTLYDFCEHEMGRDRVANDSCAPISTQVLDASPPEHKTPPTAAMNTRALMRYPSDGNEATEVRIELHRRFALPVACIALALLGIPLGIATRKGGKSAGYVIALFLSFFCYHLASLTLIGFAKQHALSVPAAVWLPDIVFILAGIVFLSRMERPGDRDLLGAVAHWFAPLGAWLRRPKPQQSTPVARLPHWRLPLLPQIIDAYILSSFMFYLAVVLASLLSMILAYNFFELMGDWIRNKIPLMEMFSYLFFLTPELIYETLPFAILVAVLVHLGVLSKQNEITAFRACGVSLFRLATPLLVAGLLFAGGLFLFDYYYVPGANLKQDAMRDEIKGRPKQTYQRADHKWIMGHSRVYYYEFFDHAAGVMHGVDVFDMDPDTFRLKRETVAESAEWSPTLKTWVFENGWSCVYAADSCSHYRPFSSSSDSQTATFSDLTEPPDYFVTAAVQEKQMNFIRLESYIHDLKERGFPAGKLQVQFYMKFALPLFALIMVMIAVPYGFLVGSRGAMAGIGLSLAIGVAYKGLGILFEKLGDIALLPPAMAAWSPDIIFGLAGLYLLLRMRS